MNISACCWLVVNHSGWAKTKRPFSSAGNFFGNFSSTFSGNWNRRKFGFGKNDPAWRRDDVQIVTDDPPSRGPLSGLAASLAQMRSAHLLALAIDMPFMSETYLRYLCDQIEAGIGVVPTFDNRAEPLAAIYPREAEIDVREALAGDDFSLQTLVCRLVAAGKLREVTVTSAAGQKVIHVQEHFLSLL